VPNATGNIKIIKTHKDSFRKNIIGRSNAVLID
jgi:hypothetical protein